jgi:hypothetical protein
MRAGRGSIKPLDPTVEAAARKAVPDGLAGKTRDSLRGGPKCLMIRHRKNQGALTKAAPLLDEITQRWPAITRREIECLLHSAPRSHKYAVAVWSRVEEAEPVYEIVHENVRGIRVAKTLAREVAKRKPDGAK